MIFQKMQERKCQKVTDRVLAVIRQQWRQTGEQQAEIGVACDSIGLSGEMILPRLNAQRAGLQANRAARPRAAPFEKPPSGGFLLSAATMRAPCPPTIPC